jgi:hypothetical protein
MLTVVSYAVRSTNGSTSTFFQNVWRGIALCMRILSVSGTSPTLDVVLQGLDGAGNINWNLAAFPQQTGVANVMLQYGPGLTDVAGQKVSGYLPRSWRVSWTIGGTTPSFGFTIEGIYLP